MGPREDRGAERSALSRSGAEVVGRDSGLTKGWKRTGLLRPWKHGMTVRSKSYYWETTTKSDHQNGQK